MAQREATGSNGKQREATGSNGKPREATGRDNGKPREATVRAQPGTAAKVWPTRPNYYDKLRTP